MSQAQLTAYDRQMYRELTAARQSRMDEPLLHSAWATGRELTLAQTGELIQEWQVRMYYPQPI